MKYLIALKHFQTDPHGDHMLNLAYHYGILYQEQHGDMLLFFREELADKRTARFFGDLLCAIFQTQYADRTYAYPTQFEPRFQISIYDVLFAFLSYVRDLTDAKHYKEVLRREFAKEKTEVEDTLPIIYLLKDNTYSVTPLDACTYGYETKMVMAKWKLHGKTQARQGVRNKQRRAVYRNFSWENLYDCCPLYWDFTEGRIENTQDIYFLARGMCGAEKGKQKFLEIMHSEKNAEQHYQNINWKEILTAIIKDNLPVPSCENCDYCDRCSHSENMLSTAKPTRREVCILKKEHYVDLETAHQDLQNAFQTAMASAENKLYLIKGQTALGKTSTYLNYMKDSVRPVVIAVPTHELKRQIFYDANLHGIEAICATPDIAAYGISEEVTEEMQDFYDIGAGAYALQFLAETLQHMGKDNPDYEKISRFLKDCKSTARFQGHIITTHAKLLHLPKEVFQTHDVILDEDIFRTIFRTESVSMQTLKKMTGSRYLPDSVKSRLNGICLKRGYHQMDEFAVELEEKQLRKIRHFGVNLYGLLRAKYIHADRERVTFLIEEPLPDCKLVMLSATVCRELYQKVYPNRAIDFHECPKAEYKGHIFQYTDSSYSRYAFQNDYDKIRLLKELCRDTTVITFKDIEKEFITHYHFGNVEGINALKGKDLSVVGLPNLDEVVYGLYAMRAGASLAKVHMYPQRITYQNKSFFLNTYKDETLRMVQTWLLSSQLEQAVGRARLLRENCRVFVYAGFPVEQAKYIDRLCVQKTE